MPSLCYCDTVAGEAGEDKTRQTHLSTGVLDGTGDGTKREGVRDDLVTVLESGRLEEEHEGRSARVEGDAVLVTGVLDDLHLGLADLALLTGVDVVPVKTAGLHELDGRFLSLHRHRVGGLDVPGHVSTVLLSEGCGGVEGRGRPGAGGDSEGLDRVDETKDGKGVR